MKKVILVADDSPTIRKFVTFSLAAKGFQIISATDGMEALEKLPSINADLIITDLNMPNVDGFELIKSVRENRAYDEVPIIILSSLGSEKDIERGLSIGANSYLVKPFDPKKINYEVSKYLS
ncbi:MAG: response regulator [Ignavibacteriales bacterium CG18_big_fil_WC_8_21_14_2_50_31_20]|nr:MAG: response regulator [Ignavibacteriales bacterium CG18_big_fil_WC_8_21_14_2_50_31_20]